MAAMALLRAIATSQRARSTRRKPRSPWRKCRPMPTNHSKRTGNELRPLRTKRSRTWHSRRVEAAATAEAAVAVTVAAEWGDAVAAAAAAMVAAADRAAAVRARGPAAAAAEASSHAGKTAATRAAACPAARASRTAACDIRRRLVNNNSLEFPTERTFSVGKFRALPP